MTESATGCDARRRAEFETFFAAECTRQVRRAALLLGSVDVANDVVAEAFARVLARWHTIDEPGAYLGRVVLNLCRDEVRHREVRRRSASSFGVEVSSDELEVLDDVLATLPFNHRAAIVLRYWGRMTTEEIAEQLGCPPGSIGPWIDRGLKKMRKALS